VQSAEVAEEDDDDRPLRPKVAEAMEVAIGIGEGDRLEGPDVHGGEDTAVPSFTPK
jgi:hypothetical protein